MNVIFIFVSGFNVYAREEPSQKLLFYYLLSTLSLFCFRFHFTWKTISFDVFPTMFFPEKKKELKLKQIFLKRHNEASNIINWLIKWEIPLWSVGCNFIMVFTWLPFIRLRVFSWIFSEHRSASCLKGKCFFKISVIWC